MPISGACRCGKIAYQVDLDTMPLTYACHCRDCQTWSGSAFALHAMLPEALLTVTGDATDFQIDANEAMASTHIGCPACMTRIANRNAAVPGMIVLRAGTLDRSVELVPAVHIWTSRKQEWLQLDGVPQFAQTPSPEEFAAALR